MVIALIMRLNVINWYQEMYGIYQAPYADIRPQLLARARGSRTAIIMMM